jgi:hypothetical protein
MSARGMRVRPVKRKPAPRYPTRDYLREHPELLDVVPERWRNNRVVLGVLGGAVFLMMASDALAGDKATQKDSAARVAPIFNHGTGRGAFGCEVVNPPVFLTEEEARSVVADEAKKAGLTFAPDALTIKNALVPVTNPFGIPARWLRTEHDYKPPAKVRDLVLDGYDKKHDVAYEFVSKSDFESWQDKEARALLSVSNYDLRETAEVVQAGLNSAKPAAYIGVFYDPMAVPPKRKEPDARLPDDDRVAFWEKRTRAGRQVDERVLREQVRDFIQWLKAQGVI